MKLIPLSDAARAGIRKVCAAIGVFDGVHLGHQQVIGQAVRDAQRLEAHSMVVTFDRHPNAIVSPAHVPPLIQTLSQRLSAIASLDVDFTLLIPFTPEFSRLTGEEFIRTLIVDFGPILSLCVGREFTFGRHRSGNVELLKRLGSPLGFTVHGLSSVALDGETVSSTRIRECIRRGELDAAGQMLGRTYALGGKVVAGDKRGRQIGFPTANLDITGLVVPPRGVYAGHARVGSSLHRAVMNIGIRPTLRDSAPSTHAEIHLLQFDGDLYGQEVEFVFLGKLREEQRFPSMEALKEQIAADIAKAESLF